MPDAISFETPENIQVRYEAAGLGTRFLAWFVDQVLLWGFCFLILFLMTVVGASFNVLVEDFGLFVFGIILLVWGLGSLLYFWLSEALLRGQTIGKRMMGIRVVKVDGFALDHGSVLVRNLFRVADNIPLLWVVPLLSKKSQRTGDMVAGTVVIVDDPQRFSDVRAELADRTAVDSEFRFPANVLQQLRAQDIQAVEGILDRWDSLADDQRSTLLDVMLEPLASRLGVELPAMERRRRFLEDLLAAEYRRQHRSLG